MTIAATLVAAILAQGPASPPISPPPREWVLGGVFVLKQEQFLRWQPVLHLTTGWHTELRVTHLLELSLWQPRWQPLMGLALAIESMPASGEPYEVGIVRPRLQYQAPNSRTKIGVELPVAAMYTPGWSGSWQVFRPRLFVAGRF
jgi:hypothetical protein